jgi:hypothetical protein
MNGVIRIDRIIGYYDVWLENSFPFAKMMVKVIERSAHDYLAVPNLMVRHKTSREPEFISGLGPNAAEAVDDLLARFAEGVRSNTPALGLTEDDFEWSAPEEF